MRACVHSEPHPTSRGQVRARADIQPDIPCPASTARHASIASSRGGGTRACGANGSRRARGNLAMQHRKRGVVADDPPTRTPSEIVQGQLAVHLPGGVWHRACKRIRLLPRRLNWAPQAAYRGEHALSHTHGVEAARRAHPAATLGAVEFQFTPASPMYTSASSPSPWPLASKFSLTSDVRARARLPLGVASGAPATWRLRFCGTAHTGWAVVSKARTQDRWGMRAQTRPCCAYLAYIYMRSGRAKRKKLPFFHGET